MARQRVTTDASVLLARSGGESVCQRSGTVRNGLLAATAFAALVGWGVFAFTTPASAQLPTGGTVVGGSATISTAPNQVTVNQTSNRGVIDWRSFSIGQGSRVDFQQPGATAVTLNRVTGPDPSVIAGQLTANGQIVLVNGAGVVFANGAQVNVGSLVASTANIVNTQDFMAGGKLTFGVPSPNANAGVVNDGTITVRDGGLVGLVGNMAANNGVINARLGRVTIGGAETFTVDLAGDGLINFQIGQPVTRQPIDGQGRKVPLASNTGTINADGGVVTMTARAAGNVVDSVVNVGGAIRAQAVSQEGGVLVLGAVNADAGDGGTVNVTGKIDVSGKNIGQRSGQVIATARGGKVNVASTAVIDASGAFGGGQVNIGGSYQGKGPIANARDTTVATGARINADATALGNGGTVIVWSDNATVFGGTITARGGPKGGDGGFVEVSGKSYLDYRGFTDLRAPFGATGTLLLDPSNIVIVDTEIGFVTILPDTPEPGTSTIHGTTTVSILTTATLQLQLGSANVIVNAGLGPAAGAGNITVSSPINVPDGRTLTLIGPGSITINAPITNSEDGGNLTLSSGSKITNTATGSISLKGSSPAGGVLTILSTPGGADLSAAPVSVGTLVLDAAGGVLVTNASNGIGEVAGKAIGPVSVTTKSALSVGAAGLGTTNSNITLQATGSLTLSGPVNTGTGTLTMQATSIIGTAGAAVVTAGTVNFTATNGDIFMTNPGNAISTLAAALSSAVATEGNSIIAISSTLPMSIGSGGISTDGIAAVVSEGQMAVNGSITAGTFVGLSGAGGILQTAGTITSPQVTLVAGPGASIVQTGGNVIATTLSVTAGDSGQLVNTGNNVTTIFGSAGGDFRYVDADTVTLGGACGTDICGITIGAGRYLDVAANGFNLFPGVLIGAMVVAGTPVDNPTGVTVLRPTTAGTAMTLGGAGTGLTEAAVINGIRTRTLRIGSIGRAADTVLGGAPTAEERAAGTITIQGINFNAGGSVIETLVLESAATGTAISQTGPLAVGHLATAVLGSGAVELTNPDNSTAGIAHIARISDTELGTQSGTFRYVDGTFIPVVTAGGPTARLIGRRDSGETPGAPSNVAILTTGGDVTLVSRSSGIQFINGLAAVGATARLSAEGNIFQDPTGGVVASALLVRSGGNFNLTAAAGLNDVRFISGIATGGSETLGDFRLINNASVTVPAGGVAGDSLVATVAGVHAGFGATLELAIRTGDIVATNTTLMAVDGLVLLRRVAGATGSEIILNNVSFDSGSGSPNLVVLDLTGSPGVLSGSFATLKSSATPPSGTSAIPLGPNPDGGILLTNVSAGNTTVYLVGGTGSTISGSGTFGLLGVYVAHSNPIALTGSVRQIDPTTSHSVTAPFSEPFDSTTFAGFYVRRRGAVVDVQTFNTCPIGTGICPEPEIEIPPTVQRPPDDPGRQVGVPDLLIIDFATDRPVPTPLGLSTVILVNQGNEYFFNVDEERRKQRAARGGQ